MSDVNAPPLGLDNSVAFDGMMDVGICIGDGLCLSSSSVEFARAGEPVTDMLSFS